MKVLVWLVTDSGDESHSQTVDLKAGEPVTLTFEFGVEDANVVLQLLPALPEVSK